MPFVGRAEELALLDAPIAAARDGTAAFAFVRGEPGIGKSRVLEELGARSSREGFTVFSGKARELERERPFAVLADALNLRAKAEDDARARLRRLLLGEREAGEAAPVADLRFRIVEEIADLIDAASRERPVLLLLDDLQWVDPSTVLALDHIGRWLAASPIAVVAAFRPLPAVPALDVLVDALGRDAVTRVTLAPLDPEAIERLVADSVSARPGEALMEQVRGAGGNPFFVRELLDVLHEEGSIRVRDGTADVTKRSLSPSLRLTILRRLAFLPDETVAALRTASVLGASFSPSDLAVISARPVAAVAAELEPALLAGVLTSADDALVFRHDLVHEAVYLDIPASVRSGLHLEAGRALTAAGADAGRVATHFALGAQRGDAEAVSWIRRAAQQALPRSPGVAADFLARATELLEPDATDRDQVLAERVDALLWASRLPDAVALARDVLSRPHDPVTAGALRTGLARALVWQGRPADSLHHLEEGLREPGLPERDRLYLTAELSLRLLHCRDLDGAEAAAAGVLATAGRDAMIEACDALCTTSWVALARGRVADAVSLAERAVALADAPGGEAARLIIPRMYLSNVLVQADRFEDADDANRVAHRDSEELATFRNEPIIQAWECVRHYLSGDWDAASAEAETSISSADEIGMRAFVLWPHAVLARLAVHRGDLRVAAELIASAEAEVAPNNLSRFGLPWLLWASATLDEARGDRAGALSLLAGTRDLLVSLDCVGETQELAPDLARMAVGAGDDATAFAAVETAELLARRAGTQSARAAALRCRGLVERDPDDLVRAVEALRATDRLVELAAASEDAGRVLAATGAPVEAAACFGDAAAIDEQIGAIRDLDRVEAALRELRVRRGVRGARRRPTFGWESLTATELGVARLAGEGLTNPEIGARLFVSKRTVGNHLAHIFTKLGITSRVQLAAEVAARPSGTEPARSVDGRTRERSGSLTQIDRGGAG